MSLRPRQPEGSPNRGGSSRGRSADTPPLPLGAWFYIGLTILILLSIIGLSFELEDTWKVSADVGVTAVTLLLLLLICLPVIVPWLRANEPSLERFFGWFRSQGIEEIESGLGRIKFASGAPNAADTYENSVLKPVNENLGPEEIEQELRDSYSEVLELTDSSLGIDPPRALRMVDELATYYDRIRESIPPSRERTRLMTQVASTMWSLMPSTEDFPVRARLNSPRGGERLSAYKYLEWRPSAEFTDSLLSRAVGALETPFGQYHALLTLRRLVNTVELTPSQEQRISDTLAWFVELEYLRGADRGVLMRGILAVLRSSGTPPSEDAALEN